MQSNTHLHFMLHRLLIKSNQNGRKGNKTRREEMLIKWRLLLFCPFLISLFIFLSIIFSFSHFLTIIRLAQFVQKHPYVNSCAAGVPLRQTGKNAQNTHLWQFGNEHIHELQRSTGLQIRKLLTFDYHLLVTSQKLQQTAILVNGTCQHFS